MRAETIRHICFLCTIIIFLVSDWLEKIARTQALAGRSADSDVTATKSQPVHENLSAQALAGRFADSDVTATESQPVYENLPGLLPVLEQMEANEFNGWYSLNDFRQIELFNGDLKKYLNKDVETYDVGEEEAGLNRYKNIRPSVDHRIKIKKVDTTIGYYNGDHVELRIGSKIYEYYAFQGPMAKTIDDFWRVVYQERLSVVVKLTRDVEGIKNKCADYYTRFEDDGGTIADIDGEGNCLRGKLEYKSELKLPGEQEKIEVRLFNLQKESKEGGKIDREFSTLNIFYPSWADHNAITVPRLVNLVFFLRGRSAEKPSQSKSEEQDEVKAVARIVKRSRESGNIGVHCSAGVGRTGTFIVADAIVGAHFEGVNDINLLELVRDTRKCRPGAVQDTPQLRLLIDLKCLFFPNKQSISNFALQ